MNLTDKEILELTELCSAVVDRGLSESQQERLSHWLATSVAARRFYVRALGLSASLHSYAGEMQAEAPDMPSRGSRIISVAFRNWIGVLAAAALVMLVFWIARQPKLSGEAPDAKIEESVAQVTASKDCKWVNSDSALHAGELLHKGQRVELAGGFAEITFDSGAQVVLEGPVLFEVNSAWDATLHHGTIKASVPPQAIGFRVANASVEVVDLGTEFTMIADASGAADVLVLKGAVEASPRNSVDPQTIRLQEKDSRHFAMSGISSVPDSEQKFVRYQAPLQLDRFAPPTGYVHWSFDEVNGRQCQADTVGLPLNKYTALLKDVTNPSAVHIAGRWQQGLHFDGRSYARAAFPGISGTSPRTVAFWVRVPEDSQLSDAYSMVGWRAQGQKLGLRPVHIGWNRNPTEGTVGVLRTDYGCGFALGATPLRDGAWHHIAVVFVPGEDNNTPVQVNQYVDGRLEGEGHPSPPGKRSDTTAATPAASESTYDTLWLGCRIGPSTPRKDRFRGDIDELYITDRAARTAGNCAAHEGQPLSAA